MCPTTATRIAGILACDRTAEGVGFEPTKDPKALNGFRDRPVQPLRHPSGSAFAGNSRRRRLAASSAYHGAYQCPTLRPRVRRDFDQAPLPSRPDLLGVE